MSKSLGTGIDPLELIDALRRRRACATALLKMSSTAGRALRRGHDRRGPRPREQALERRAADPARAPTTCEPDAARGATVGRLDADAARPRRIERDLRAASTAYDFSARRQGALPASSGTTSATGTSRPAKPRLYSEDRPSARRSRRRCAVVLDRTLRLLPPGDAARDRGALALRRRRRAADARGVPRGGEIERDPEAESAVELAIEAVSSCAVCATTRGSSPRDAARASSSRAARTRTRLRRAADLLARPRRRDAERLGATARRCRS